MARRISQRLDRLFRRETQSLVSELSARSEVLAVLVTTVRCPNCIWDSSSQTSRGIYREGGPEPFTGPVCPVCESNGELRTETQRPLRARVRFGDIDREGDRYSIAGAVPQDHAELKVRIQDVSQLEAAEYFWIDGVRYRPVGQVVRRGLLTYAVANLMTRRDD